MTSAVVGPARIGWRPKLLTTLAGFESYCLTMPAGVLTAAYVALLLDPAERARGAIWWLILALVVALVGVALGQLLIVAALGRRRTGGCAARFGRYQLGALGAGAAIGVGFSPGIVGAGALAWVPAISGAVALMAVSLLAFRPSRRRLPPDPPPAGTAVVPGMVVDHWWGVPRANGPQLSLVEYADEWGRVHRAMHILQDGFAGIGVTGLVWIRRDRPDRPLRFVVRHGRGDG
ncbi:MAG: hypothetical protein ACTHZX_01290 [Microbacterium sp.]